MVFPVVDDAGGFGADAFDFLELMERGLESGGGGAEGLDESADADWADFRELIEGDESFDGREVHACEDPFR